MHDGHDGHDDGVRAHHGSLRGYLTGFVLVAILTIIPFWLVMDDVIENSVITIIVVLALAAVQIVVHIVYFLHLDTRYEGGWNMLTFIRSEERRAGQVCGSRCRSRWSRH